MGMAASQARFLSLTARKTNTEYQGQQVNQQRTALSNESAALYNQMMMLEVPTPPSANSYYRYSYSFKSADGLDDATEYQITDISKSKGTVSIEYTEEKGTIALSTFAKNPTDILHPTSGRSNEITDSTEYNRILNLGRETGNPMWDKKADGTDPKIYSVEQDGVAYYITENGLYDQDGNELGGTVRLWKEQDGSVTKKKELNVQEFKTDSKTGRLKSIKLGTVDDPDLNGRIHSNEEFVLDLTKTENEDDFEEAMRDYEYQKQLYEKRYSDLDAKSKSIQRKDKNLELKLKQLDTEQNAIQTEMEAVKSVIKKNVEDTFKTFNA